MKNPHQGARLTVYSREQIVVRLQAGVRAVEVAAGGRAALSNGASVPARVAGYVAVDDATRLACVEVLGDERCDTTTAFILRALRWFRAHGIRAERVMTDNGSRPPLPLHADLPRWLDWFNRLRPHTAPGGLPPLKRVNNLVRNQS